MLCGGPLQHGLRPDREDGDGRAVRQRGAGAARAARARKDRDRGRGADGGRCGWRRGGGSGGGESASLRATANLRVLYLDENAVPLLSERRSEVLLETDLPGSGQARVQDMYAGEIAASVGADGVELRFPVTFAVSVAETPRYPCLQSLEAEECGKKDENVPSLVLRAMKQGERLWDIAKLYRTTVEAILAANELKEESAAVIGKLLLIPRRR